MSGKGGLVRPTMWPLAALCEVELADANRCLVAWGHRMGRLHRGCQGARSFVLFEGSEPVGVACASALIGEIAGGVRWLTRDRCVELSRLCASRPGLCRVVLRLWREVCFPLMGREFAVSYQDAVIHSGATYRFDGWQRVAFSHSGFDRRSGRLGRDKWVWVWPPGPPAGWVVVDPGPCEAATGPD